MPDAKTPEGWAIRISRILNAVLGVDHFPIGVAQVAKEISRQLYPDDPITRVTGDKLRSFEGALVRAPSGRKGWGILYNTDIASPGRINFTLAHEFGHYLLHRSSYPEGFNCSTEDMVRWDIEYGRVEHQANVFASYLLMPLDDFRRRLSPSTVPDLDALSDCGRPFRRFPDCGRAEMAQLHRTPIRAGRFSRRIHSVGLVQQGGVSHRRALQNGESAATTDPGGVAGRTWAQG